MSMTQKISLPKVSIFEAEILLSDAMALLKKSANLEPIKTKIVGDYWEETWRRAPFEECMTFKQLASIQFDNLIRKKSLDSDKMVALSFAIRKALAAEQSVSEPTEVAAKKTEHTIPLPVNLNLPPTVAALYIGLKQFALAIPDGHSLGIAAQKCFETLEPIECVAAWLVSSYSIEVAALLLGSSQMSVASRCKKAKKNIASIFHYAAPECYLHWSTALTGPGASIKYLTSPYLYAKGIPKEFIESLCFIFLDAIGAQHIELNKRKMPDHFSLTPKTAQKILDALKISPKASNESIKKVLSLPFPFFDIDSLTRAVKGVGRK